MQKMYSIAVWVAVLECRKYIELPPERITPEQLKGWLFHVGLLRAQWQATEDSTNLKAGPDIRFIMA